MGGQDYLKSFDVFKQVFKVKRSNNIPLVVLGRLLSFIIAFFQNNKKSILIYNHTLKVFGKKMNIFSSFLFS